jgi:exodeoxyribonuclease X
VKISDAVFVVVDTETTGLDPKVDGLVEIGAVATTNKAIVGMWSTLVNPLLEISPEITAIHGITNAQVFDAPTEDQALPALSGFLDRFSNRVIVAHNLEFDSAFLRMGADGLCTKRLAQHLWGDYPAHKNQTLRYRRELRVENFGIDAHRALGDALVTAALLRDELSSPEFVATGISEVADLIAYAESPILFATFPFGKHRGEPISSAPASYVVWCLREMKDLSRDMRFTLEQRLQAAA